MTPETQPTQNRSRIWQWLVILLVIVVSFACVFFSAQGALMSDQDRVIKANMLADSRVSYNLDPKKDISFAPLDNRIIIEATQDASGLVKTPSVQSGGNTPVSVAELPDTKTPKPTNIPTKNPPTQKSEDTATKVSPSNTPIPPTETNIPPTSTPIPATATHTATINPTETATNPPPAPTRTPTEKPTKKTKDTQTPIPTSSPTQTATAQPTFTRTAASTYTPTPIPTNTPVSPPTDTPIPPPSFTPTPNYKEIRPLLTCVRDNGDGTYTAYFGYNNRNDYTVNIPHGNRNRVVPGSVVSGQPTNFSPGQHDSVFNVDFQIGAMYILDGRVRVAGPSNTCP